MRLNYRVTIQREREKKHGENKRVPENIELQRRLLVEVNLNHFSWNVEKLDNGINRAYRLLRKFTFHVFFLTEHDMQQQKKNKNKQQRQQQQNTCSFLIAALKFETFKKVELSGKPDARRRTNEQI